MKIKTSLENCKKLLDILSHEKPSCTDCNCLNQYPDSAGWVSCARCWLVQTAHNNYVQEDTEIEIYVSIKMAKKDIDLLIKKYVKLIDELGVHHPCTVQFYENNKENKNFVELADIAINLKGIE